MNRVIISSAAVLVTFTFLHSCEIDGIESDFNRPAEVQTEEEPQRKLKQWVYDEMPYLKEYSDDDKKTADESDSSLIDTFIAGIAAAGIWSVILWAINKYKNRK